MLKKKVKNYSKLFTLNTTNSFLGNLHINYSKTKPKVDSFYKHLSTETNEKPFKISSDSTAANSPMLEKTKLKLGHKNTLFGNILGSGSIKLKTRNKVTPPPEQISEPNTIEHSKNLTQAPAFPKVLSLNSFQIDDFSVLSFGKEKELSTTGSFFQTNTIKEKKTETLDFPVKTEIHKSLTKDFFQAKTFSHKLMKSKGKLKLQRNDSFSPSNIFLQFPKYPSSKYSSEEINAFLKSYAVNSYKGLFRNYNEDKVSIILSITKPKSVIIKEGEQWPENCSFFGIYDGHGGNKCCNFLRDNLHNYVIKNKYFPKDPEKALLYAFEKAEKDFIYKIAVKEENKSGSCALVALIINNICYFANCGDSRAIASFNGGKTIKIMTKDHKPNDPDEKKRIIESGGNVYSNKQQNDFSQLISSVNEKEIFRIVPGHLSVSRALGDIDAKFSSLGGKWGVLIPTPEITRVELDSERNKIDFIFMGCDGIYDRLTTEECAQCIWNVTKKKVIFDGVHTLSGGIVDMVMKTALKRKTSDNLTAIFLSFANFLEIFKDK